MVAIVTAAFFCIGLLFLLVKESRIEGYVQVTVTGDQLSHATQVYVSNMAQVGLVEKNVNYVREMVAHLP